MTSEGPDSLRQRLEELISAWRAHAARNLTSDRELWQHEGRIQQNCADDLDVVLRDAASALASQPQPCDNCGCEERDHRGILTCRRPDGARPDVRGIIEALGFDPTNHHNAAKCPYCTQGGYPSSALASPPEHDERTHDCRASEQPAASGPAGSPRSPQPGGSER